MEPLFELEIATAARGSREVASGLHRQLKAAILEGRLRPGFRLPATRTAPEMFGVSRNTAQDVYDRLAHEGLISAQHGSGTFVAEIRPRTASQNLERPALAGRVNPFWERPEIDAWMGFWHDDHLGTLPDPRVELRPGLVDQRLFPHAAFRQMMARQLRKLEISPPSARSPRRNQGHKQLREAIAEHIGWTRAVACHPDDILVTTGTQQALDLLARALVFPGETVVAIEDPCYPPMRVPFAAAGAKIVPVAVDAEGIVVDAIPPDAGIICVAPSHQFPLGMTMSAERRQALLRFAERTGALIVEDDYDGEFRYDASPLEALRGNATSDVVCYVGSFSKCMFPTIRLGFMIPPQRILPALVTAKKAIDWQSSVPVQAAVAGFIHDGHLTRHIRRVRRIYRQRRDALVAMLQRHLKDALTVVPSFYGMHIAVLARAGIDCQAISRSLAEQGIMLHSLDRYFFDPAKRQGFVIAYAAADVDELALAVDALASEIRLSAVS